MKKIIILIVFILITTRSFSQNCWAFKYYGDTLQYRACLIAEKAQKYYQFSKEFQEIYDQALKICPYFSYGYREKSVAYLKSGDFITWKILIDKAVELKPLENLGYRGWCRYQFFKDYEGAIADIEKLDSLVSYDIGYSINGDYHLNVAKALCYKALGNREKAIHIIECQLKEKNYIIKNYDYLHLGVLYFENKDFKSAEEKFKLQDRYALLAENQYYLAMIEKNKKNYKLCRKLLKKAKQLYIRKMYMFDPYTAIADKIYLDDIQQELRLSKKYPI